METLKPRPVLPSLYLPYLAFLISICFFLIYSYFFFWFSNLISLCPNCFYLVKKAVFFAATLPRVFSWLSQLASISISPSNNPFNIDSTYLWSHLSRRAFRMASNYSKKPVNGWRWAKVLMMELVSWRLSDWTRALKSKPPNLFPGIFFSGLIKYEIGC